MFAKSPPARYISGASLPPSSTATDKAQQLASALVLPNSLPTPLALLHLYPHLLTSLSHVLHALSNFIHHSLAALRFLAIPQLDSLEMVIHISDVGRELAGILASEVGIATMGESAAKSLRERGNTPPAVEVGTRFTQAQALARARERTQILAQKAQRNTTKQELVSKPSLKAVDKPVGEKELEKFFLEKVRISRRWDRATAMFEEFLQGVGESREVLVHLSREHPVNLSPLPILLSSCSTLEHVLRQIQQVWLRETPQTWTQSGNNAVELWKLENGWKEVADVDKKSGTGIKIEVQTLLQHLLTTHILGRAHWNELMAELNIPWVDMIELAEARQKKLLEMQELERKEREKMETEMLNQERELLMKKMD